MNSINIHDLHKKARRTLPKMVYDYLEGGADDELGLQRNVSAFQGWQFVPRRLHDLRTVSCNTTILGHDSRFPAVVAPTGLNSLFWPQADSALAKAASRQGIPFTLSTASSMSLEDIASSASGPLWFQLYVIESGLARSLIQRAQQSGYQCLVVTTDVVSNGKRERDLRNGFGLPVRYTWRTVLDGIRHPAWSWRYLRHGLPVLGNFNTPEAQTPEARAALLSRSMDAGFDWQALDAIRQQWPGKLLVKGLLHPDDIRRCHAMGADGVVLSNHGGRQLDDACSALTILAQLPAYHNFEIFIDGGVRRGSDIAKAVALGARAVFIGRAVLYGLASAGEKGALHALQLLYDEYRNTLIQLGCPATVNLKRDYLYQAKPQAFAFQASDTFGHEQPCAAWPAKRTGS